MATMMSKTPQPIIIILPEAGTGWIRGARNIRTPPLKPRNPNKPAQPIPTYDWKAHRERVARLLRQTQHQRDELRALAHG
jgi:hypothetical protein